MFNSKLSLKFYELVKSLSEGTLYQLILLRQRKPFIAKEDFKMAALSIVHVLSDLVNRLLTGLAIITDSTIKSCTIYWHTPKNTRKCKFDYILHFPL